MQALSSILLARCERKIIAAVATFVKCFLIELVTEHLMESQCKNCPISHTSKVAVSACPEELPDQRNEKLLTACELRNFLTRAKVKKVYGSADLLPTPFVQCPI